MAVSIQNVLVVNETGKALLVELLDTGREMWVPKSAIDKDSLIKNTTPSGRGPAPMLLRTWFAKAEGLEK
jgi:hypothetical protein